MIRIKRWLRIGIISLAVLIAGCENPTKSDGGKNGSRIVFSATIDGQYDIYMMDTDGSNLQNLTNTERDEKSPVFSPDASKIVYLRYWYGIPYIMNADGSDTLRLADYDVTGTPVFSPDGSQILFSTSTGWDGGVYLVGIDGKNLRQIIDEEAIGLSWSPDGTHIAMSLRTGTTSWQTDMREIFVVNADGSNLQQVTSDSVRNFDPAWAPDGSTIAYISDRNTTKEIYTITPDGADQTRVTDVDRYVVQFEWSPDSRKIVFTEAEDKYGGSNIAIWRVEADGAAQTKLTSNSGINTDPSWAPDGSKIVFSSTMDMWDIYKMNSNGSNQKRLTNFDDMGYICSDPQWSPVPVP